MQIDKKYKLEKVAVASKEKDIFSHILVENNHAIATNRSLVAIVPCALSEKDVPGPITQESLVYARKHTLGEKCLAMSLNSASHLTCEDTTEFPRSYSSFVDSQGELFRDPPKTFPPLSHLVSPPYANSVTLRLNPSQLRLLAAALGDADFIELHLPYPNDYGKIEDMIRVFSHLPSEHGFIFPLSIP